MILKWAIICSFRTIVASKSFFLIAFREIQKKIHAINNHQNLIFYIDFAMPFIILTRFKPNSLQT